MEARQYDTKAQETKEKIDKFDFIWYNTYNGILFSDEKEWSTDTCYNVDEPRKHYTKWKNPDTKGHILYDCIYIKYPY